MMETQKEIEWGLKAVEELKKYTKTWCYNLLWVLTFIPPVDCST